MLYNQFSMPRMKIAINHLSQYQLSNLHVIHIRLHTTVSLSPSFFSLTTTSFAPSPRKEYLSGVSLAIVPLFNFLLFDFENPPNKGASWGEMPAKTTIVRKAGFPAAVQPSSRKV